MKEFEKYNDLAEVLRTYSRHSSEEADDDIRKACDHLIEVFKASMLEDDPLAAFVGQLKKDASYSSWKPDIPASPECPWCHKRLASPQEPGWWLCPCGKSFGEDDEPGDEQPLSVDFQSIQKPEDGVHIGAVVMAPDHETYEAMKGAVEGRPDGWTAADESALEKATTEWEKAKQEEAAAEQEAYEQAKAEECEEIYNVLRHWPNNVLLTLKRMLAIEAQQPSHANRDGDHINHTIGVIADILTNDRGVDADVWEADVWEQSTVRQVLAEFPDSHLRILLASLMVEDQFEAKPVNEWARRRADLVLDILRTRTYGTARIDIDESPATAREKLRQVGPHADVGAYRVTVVENFRQDEPLARVVRKVSEHDALASEAVVTPQGIRIYPADYEYDPEEDEPGILPLDVTVALLKVAGVIK